MSTKANNFKIGLFVIVSLGVLVLAIILLSADTIMADKFYIETYIPESVQGLDVGSPVMQLGVKIGRVERITFVVREYDLNFTKEEAVAFGKYVMVVIAIDRDDFPRLPRDEQLDDLIEDWVDNGYRLKLSSQGITGIAYLEADYVDPERYLPMEPSWTPEHTYVPSAPSVFKSFTDTLDNILTNLERIKFEQLADSMDQTLIAVRGALEEAKISEVRRELVGLLSEMRQTNQRIQMVLGDEPVRQDQTIPQAVSQFFDTLGTLEKFVDSQQGQIEEIVLDIRKASRNIRELSDYAKRYPAQVIFSGPPEQSEVVK